MPTDKSIEGYVIVRKPECISDLHVRHSIEFSSQNQKKVAMYAGIDRQPWSDLDDAHYANAVPKEIESIWQALRQDKIANSDLRVLKNLASARLVLDFLRQSEDRNEICAIYASRSLGSTKETTISEQVSWLGIDLYVTGYGSAIKQGFFAKPELFLEFSEKINRFGLFNIGDGVLRKYRKHLSQVARQNNLEVMPDIDELWCQIAVGRVV